MVQTIENNIVHVQKEQKEAQNYERLKQHLIEINSQFDQEINDLTKELKQLKQENSLLKEQMNSSIQQSEFTNESLEKLTKYEKLEKAMSLMESSNKFIKYL